MTKQAIDTEFLRNIIENDKEFEKELFEIFVENANRNIAKMEAAMKEADNNSWYMSSHAFKGAAGSVGAFDLSRTLEYAQKHPDDSALLKEETLKKVKEELNLVLEFIAKEMV
jgi:HPt (histidine-containing phosphotransfer) domain-containing protein